MHNPNYVTPLTFTVEQAARALNVSRSSVYAFISSGKLKPALIAGRKLIAASDLQALVESSQPSEAA